jgi:hypothetical protein
LPLRLAKILTLCEVPVFSTVAYASNYRIMGVEISATPQAVVNYGLVSPEARTPRRNRARRRYPKT